MNKLLKCALWTGAGLVGGVFALQVVPIRWIYEEQRDEMMILTPIVAIMGAILFLFALCLAGLWRLLRGRMGWRPALGVPAVTAAAVLLTPYAWLAGGYVYAWGVLTFARSWMERSVAEAQARPEAFAGYNGIWGIPRDGDNSLIPVTADKGPPVRVIFRTSTWLMGDWRGIVFDPDGRLTAILSCTHMRGSWYYCHRSS